MIVLRKTYNELLLKYKQLLLEQNKNIDINKHLEKEIEKLKDKNTQLEKDKKSLIEKLEKVKNPTKSLENQPEVSQDLNSDYSEFKNSASTDSESIDKRFELYLESLEKLNKTDYITTTKFSEITNISILRIKKDISLLSGVSGVRGKGYQVKKIIKGIKKYIVSKENSQNKFLKSLNIDELESIEFEIQNLDPEKWFEIAKWCQENKVLNGWWRKFFFSLGTYKKRNGILTKKQVGTVIDNYILVSREMKSFSGETNCGAVKENKIPNIKILDIETIIDFDHILEKGLEDGYIKGDILQNIDYTLEKQVKDFYEAIEILQERGIQIT